MVRLKVEYLPGERREAKPLWLWSSATGIDTAHLDRIWRTFLRRFDLEHIFRLLKGTLGWTAPQFRAPDTADLWTWLVIVAHTQLRLARPLAADLRRPWERPLPTAKLTPAWVRRGFRNIRAKVPTRPECRNPSGPAPDGHRVRRTASRHPATTSARRSNANPHSKPTSPREVKDQAIDSLFGGPSHTSSTAGLRPDLPPPGRDG